MGLLMVPIKGINIAILKENKLFLFCKSSIFLSKVLYIQMGLLMVQIKGINITVFRKKKKKLNYFYFVKVPFFFPYQLVC